MLITVAVCTWNRSALLAQTLASLTACEVPDGTDWEVLVVANRCTDDTAEVALTAAALLPVRVVEEPVLGLSHARNTAVREARGEFIVWIDDDVLVDRGWLAAYARAFAAHRDAAFFGGPIRAWFPSPPPPWLVAAMPAVGNAFSLLEHDPGFKDFDADTIPFGANFAVRADVQRRLPYDPALGRRGRGRRSGEESAVLMRILAEGGRGVWLQDAVVRHYVAPERQSVRHLRRYYFHNGASLRIMRPMVGARRFLGEPLWVWRQAIEYEVRYWLSRAVSPPDVWARHLRHATSAWGYLYGAIIAARLRPVRRAPPAPA